MITRNGGTSSSVDILFLDSASRPLHLHLVKLCCGSSTSTYPNYQFSPAPLASVIWRSFTAQSNSALITSSSPPTSPILFLVSNFGSQFKNFSHLRDLHSSSYESWRKACPRSQPVRYSAHVFSNTANISISALFVKNLRFGILNLVWFCSYIAASGKS